jgi:hypothetical protein
MQDDTTESGTPPRGETDLDRLIAGMEPVLASGTYVFAHLADRDAPPDIDARMRFEEAEGTTLILLEAEARRHGLPWVFPCRMITLDVHSSLEAVGFIARVATALAAAGMGVNPVSGFFHDHLFVPLGREEEAMRIIARMRAAAGA